MSIYYVWLSGTPYVTKYILRSAEAWIPYHKISMLTINLPGVNKHKNFKYTHTLSAFGVDMMSASETNLAKQRDWNFFNYSATLLPTLSHFKLF